MIRLSGRFRSALIIGGQGIRARKLRTFLSMVSLFLGVLAVVVGAGRRRDRRAGDAGQRRADRRARTAPLADVRAAQAETVAGHRWTTLRGRTDAVGADQRPGDHRRARRDAGQPGRGAVRRRTAAGGSGTMICDAERQLHGAEPGAARRAGRPGDRAAAGRADRRHPAVPAVPPELRQWLDFTLGAVAGAAASCSTRRRPRASRGYRVPAEMRRRRRRRQRHPAASSAWWTTASTSRPRYVRADELHELAAARPGRRLEHAAAWTSSCSWPRRRPTWSRPCGPG